MSWCDLKEAGNRKGLFEMKEIKGWLKKIMQETDLKQKVTICIFQSDFLQNLFQESSLNPCFAIPFSGVGSGGRGHVSQAPPDFCDKRS